VGGWALGRGIWGVPASCVMLGDPSPLLAFWNRVLWAFNGRSSAIPKIDRVLQRDGLVRFDVYYTQGQGAHVRERLQRFTYRWGWYLRRLHRSYWDRHAASPPPPLHPLPSPLSPMPVHLCVATLNVNGLSSKVEDVGALIIERSVNVLLVQKTTVRATDMRVRFNGYSDYCL